MVDSHDDDDDGRANENENDIESPAEPSPSTTSATPASIKHISAEPPRWRFVGDAKRSSGYSSLAAGQYIQGKSSEELGAKYVAPDVSLYKAKREKLGVGKLQHQLPTSNNYSKEDVEVGKLKLNVPNDDTSSSQSIDAGKLEKKPIEEDELSELQIDVHDKPFEEGDENNDDTSSSQNIEAGKLERKPIEEDELSDLQTDVHDKSFEEGDENVGGESPNCTQSNGETPSGAASRPDLNEGSQLDDQLDEEAMKEGTKISSSEALNDEDVDNAAKDSNPKRRYRFLYFMLLLLLILVIVLGVVLGKKDNAGEASASSDNAAAIPDVLGPTIAINSTSRPSFYPSIISTNELSTRPSASPSKQPTTSPRKQPTASPSKAPNEQPTEVPSRIPSPLLTPPPTNIPTSRPTCSADKEAFRLCLAINMSGSICNGRTGALCVGCPQIFQSSVFQASYCRDTSVNWNSCCSNFANVKALATVIVNLLGDLPVDKSFSVVQFASDARVVSGLSSTAQTLSTIVQLTYSGGLDNHASAIQMCQQTLSSSSNGKRFIMLLTDGETGVPDYVSESAAESAATSAKSEGTFVIPILVAPDAPDTNEGAIPLLSRLSSDGEVFDFTDYDMSSALQVQEQLLDHVSCSQG